MYLYRKVLVLSLLMMSVGWSITKYNIGLYENESIENITESLKNDNENNSNYSRDLGDIINEYEIEVYESTGIVWVENDLYIVRYYESELIQFNLQDGVIAVHSIHPFPYGMTWDGESLWIGNENHMIYSYDLQGSLIDSIINPATGYPSLSFDGQYLVASESLTVTDPNFYKLDFDGSIIEEYPTTMSTISQIVWVDEHESGNIWTMTEGGGNGDENSFIRQYEYGNFNMLNEFDLDIPSCCNYTLTHDGTDLWTLEWDGILYQLDDGISEDNDSGCTDPYACNYNPDAIEDDGSCSYEEDCAGECGGNAVVDDCGICDGGNASYDCNNVCSGSLSAGTYTNTNPGGAVDPSAPITVFCSADDGSWNLSPCVLLEILSEVDNGDGTYTFTSVYGSDADHACELSSDVFNGEVDFTNVSTHDVAAGWAIVGDFELIFSSSNSTNFSVTSTGTFDYIGEDYALNGSLSGGSSGGLVYDECGVCDGDAVYGFDCSGVCDGYAVVDDCGVCDGGNADMDCAGVCDGNAVLSGCDNECNSTAIVDCAGNCGGDAALDDCGICDGGNADQDCAGVCFGDSAEDNCGVCDGGNADQDCAGVCFGDAVLSGCDNACNSTLTNDFCGVCDGDGSTCEYGCEEGVQVCLTLDGNNLDYQSTADIAGFQFNHDGCVTGASGGDASSAAFVLSCNSSACIGFSFIGSVIPAGSGTLVELTGALSQECLSNFIFSDAIGGGLVVNFSIGGCIDSNACNYVPEANTDDGSCTYAEENYDCDGNCVVGEDSCGECGGNDWDMCDEDNNGVPNYEQWGYGAHTVIVNDILEDQGGRVHLQFNPSFYDTDTLSRSETYTIERMDGEIWMVVQSFGAYGANQYNVEANTLFNNIDTEFRIIANMDEGNFETIESIEGMSIDNIDPATPTSLMATHSNNDLSLSWSYLQDIDFNYHQINDLSDINRYSTENQITFNQDESYEEYTVNSVDINGNLSENSNHTSVHDLHYGANLIGINVLPENLSVGTVFESLESNANSIIGEGQAASLDPTLGWIGSLNSISPGSGYWVIADSEDMLIIPGERVNCEQLTYQLHIGANLISFCCEEPVLLDIIPEECSSIIGEGTASTYNPELGWIGSLSELSPGKGYWLSCSESVQINWDCSE